MPHILFVCTANICRSPVAEALFRDLAQRQGLSGWTASSAGTWALESRGAAELSQALMAERGLDLSRHRARMVDKAMIAAADVVLCMEAGHAEALRAEFPRYGRKIHLMSELAGRRYSIPDPYGGPRAGYERMVEDLEGLLVPGLDRLVALAAPPEGPAGPPDAR